MAFYFALFNVSSVNLEEAARRKKQRRYKSTHQLSNDKRRSKSADRNRHVSTKSSDVMSISSIDSAPLVIGDDYRLLPRPQILSPDESKTPPGPSVQSPDSSKVSPILPNGDADFPRRSSLRRRNSLTGYKKVTFVSHGNNSSQESLLERSPDLGTKVLDPIFEKKTAQLSITDKKKKFVGRSESFLGFRRPHLPNVHLPPNMGTAAENRPKLTALNKLRMLIAKIVEQNRQSRLLQQLWENGNQPQPKKESPQLQQLHLPTQQNEKPVVKVKKAASFQDSDVKKINGKPKRLVVRLNGLPNEEAKNSWQNAKNEIIEERLNSQLHLDETERLVSQEEVYRAAGARPKVSRANTMSFRESGQPVKMKVNNGKSFIIRRRSTSDRKQASDFVPIGSKYTMITESRTKIISSTPIYCENTFTNNNNNKRRFFRSIPSYRNPGFQDDSPPLTPTVSRLNLTTGASCPKCNGKMELICE